VKTLRLSVDPAHLETAEAQEALQRGAEILRAGPRGPAHRDGLRAGSERFGRRGRGRIFAAKQRPAGPDHRPRGQHLHAGRPGQRRPEAARKLMEAFWPGPLTLLLRGQRRSRRGNGRQAAGRHPHAGAPGGARTHPESRRSSSRASANTFGHTAHHGRACTADLDGASTPFWKPAHGTRRRIHVLDPCQSPW